MATLKETDLINVYMDKPNKFSRFNDFINDRYSFINVVVLMYLFYVIVTYKSDEYDKHQLTTTLMININFFNVLLKYLFQKDKIYRKIDSKSVKDNKKSNNYKNYYISPELSGFLEECGFQVCNDETLKKVTIVNAIIDYIYKNNLHHVVQKDKYQPDSRLKMLFGDPINDDCDTNDYGYSFCNLVFYVEKHISDKKFT